MESNGKHWKTPVIDVWSLVDSTINGGSMVGLTMIRVILHTYTYIYIYIYLYMYMQHISIYIASTRHSDVLSFLRANVLINWYHLVNIEIISSYCACICLWWYLSVHLSTYASIQSIQFITNLYESISIHICLYIYTLSESIIPWKKSCIFSIGLQPSKEWWCRMI